MFLSYQQIASAVLPKRGTDVAIPGNATGVCIQAETQNIRYTMDNVTIPTTTVGMVLVAGTDAKEFLMEDFRRLQFIAGSGGVGTLHCHFFGGRDI